MPDMPETTCTTEICPDPACGAPATIVDRWSFGSTSGPIEHVKTRCERGHWLTPPVESLGHTGRALLRHRGLRRRRGYASFDSDWVPADYLSGYYSTVEPDEIATIAFLVDAMRRCERDQPVLFFGVGPTLHHVFAAAPVASEIHLGDYLHSNLAEIRRWIDRDPTAHDWRPFVRHTLECEGISMPTESDLAAREDLTRAKITELLQVDARHPRPVDRLYAAVVSAYCADSATDDRATWALFMHHITGLVRPDGLFVTAALRRCRGYTVGGKAFPSADVDEHDLRAVLHRELGPTDGTVEVRQVGQDSRHGYSAILLAWARMRTDLPIHRTQGSCRGPMQDRPLAATWTGPGRA